MPSGGKLGASVGNFGGFLDTRNADCQGNRYCVSTSAARERVIEWADSNRLWPKKWSLALKAQGMVVENTIQCCASFHHLAIKSLAADAKSVSIYKAENFSDHAPLTIEYDWLF